MKFGGPKGENFGGPKAIILGTCQAFSRPSSPFADKTHVGIAGVTFHRHVLGNKTHVGIAGVTFHRHVLGDKTHVDIAGVTFHRHAHSSITGGPNGIAIVIVEGG